MKTLIPFGLMLLSIGLAPLRADLPDLEVLSASYHVWGNAGYAVVHTYDQTSGSPPLTGSISGVGYTNHNVTSTSTANYLSLYGHVYGDQYSGKAYASATYTLRFPTTSATLQANGEIYMHGFENKAYVTLQDLNTGVYLENYTSPNNEDFSFNWTRSYTVNTTHSYQLFLKVMADAGDIGNQDASLNVAIILPNAIELQNPLGGEHWQAGTLQPIRWDTRGTITSTLVEFSTDNGATWQPVFPVNAAPAGPYDWRIPQVASNQCRVRVTANGDPALRSTSGAFTIYICPLAGDLNGDCCVNLLDLAIMAHDWMQCG